MPTYNSVLFAPPAPVAVVTLRQPESGATRDDVLMLLDTGADVTLLPLTAVNALGVPASTDKHYELIDFEGHVSLSRVVQAEMVFMGFTFRGQFLLIEQDWGIIGRNVLNSIPLLFDGPRLLWQQSPQ